MQKILDYEATGKKFNFFHFMLDLDQGPCAIKRLRGCGCGNEYVAITPDGDIYHVISLSVRQTIKWATWTTAHSTVK